MSSGSGKFGAFIRHEREAKEISLREMAKMIGVSPTCLSKIEQDEFPPPAEDKVKAIAKFIGRDADGLLARAGRACGIRLTKSNDGKIDKIINRSMCGRKG
jgi:transcriptional regulator with XRE-family HTH domain